MFVLLSRLFIAALWSPAGTSWLLFVMLNCDFVTYPCGILGQVWYLIVLIPDLAVFLTLMLPGLPANVFFLQENMTRKCHNHRLQTGSLHHEERTQIATTQIK